MHLPPEKSLESLRPKLAGENAEVWPAAKRKKRDDAIFMLFSSRNTKDCCRKTVRKNEEEKSVASGEKDPVVFDMMLGWVPIKLPVEIQPVLPSPRSVRSIGSIHPMVQNHQCQMAD